MARCHSLVALALLAAACSDSTGATAAIDARSSFCTTSFDCSAVGSWCNPKPVDTDPTHTICEPRGAVVVNFDRDIFPTLGGTCAGCHVPGTPDPQVQGGTLTVFSGGADVAFASLTQGGVDCTRAPHKLCVNEPMASQAVVRLLAHAGTGSQKLLPMGYSDAFMQKLLHWIAAGATRSGFTVDAPLFDAPIIVPDAGEPDAPNRPDARPDFDALLPKPGKPVITAPVANASTGSKQIPVTWTAAPDNGFAITKYDVSARRVSDGTTTTVTVGGTTLNATISGLVNCSAYDVTVTATNANGSTDSDPVLNVTPRVTPTAPSALTLSQPAGVSGQLLFSWTASSGDTCGTPTYTVRLVPPSDVSCGNGNGVACNTNRGTATNFTMTTTAGICNYPTFNCGTFRRSWSFSVQASNSGGTTTFVGPVAGSPRMSYVNDNIVGIFSDATVNPDQLRCIDCHCAACGNPLVLEGTNTTTFNSIHGNPPNDPSLPPVLNLTTPSSSLLHVCPTGGCMDVGMPLRFNSGTLPDNAIIRWITDGAVF